jgi:hypothetical protein
MSKEQTPIEELISKYEQSRIKANENAQIFSESKNEISKFSSLALSYAYKMIVKDLNQLLIKEKEQLINK